MLIVDINIFPVQNRQTDFDYRENFQSQEEYLMHSDNSVDSVHHIIMLNIR